ncbi:hypothetical protein ACNHUS_09150 [Actinomycetes bacterium M1A6_2h]
MPSSAASLALWTGSWLGGGASPDDVIDAVCARAPMNLVVAGDVVTADRCSLPWPTPRDLGVTELLRVVREAATSAGPNATVRLVLPAPGDVRGLPVRSDFSTAAVLSGEGVLVGAPGATGIGIVPAVEGPDVLRWSVFATDVPEFVPDASLREIEYSMRETVREAALTLTRQQTVGTSAASVDARSVIDAHIDEANRHAYPPMDERITRILDTADRVAAILAVAEKNSPAQGTTGSAALAREDVLRPLYTAVRSARLVAIGTAIDEALGRH